MKINKKDKPRMEMVVRHGEQKTNLNKNLMMKCVEQRGDRRTEWTDKTE